MLVQGHRHPNQPYTAVQNLQATFILPYILPWTLHYTLPLYTTLNTTLYTIIIHCSTHYHYTVHTTTKKGWKMAKKGLIIFGCLYRHPNQPYTAVQTWQAKFILPYIIPYTLHYILPYTLPLYTTQYAITSCTYCRSLVPKIQPFFQFLGFGLFKGRGPESCFTCSLSLLFGRFE